MVRISSAAALGVLALSISGCAGIGKSFGEGKTMPDEFAIATKAPLVVPPDFSLRPPRPGESRPQELSASERAQQVLMGDATAAPPSVGEQALLQKANVVGADPNIRSVLGAENGGHSDKERSFANQLMFWKFVDGKVDDSAAPLRVEDPEAWMAERKTAIEAVTGENSTVVIKSDEALLLPGIR
jgi:hypothetical protein